jgi:hypothetical protein
MTDELLKGMCAQVANMAKTELRYRHELNGILACYHEGEGLHRMRDMERLLVELAGKAWANSGRAKDAIVATLCLGTKSVRVAQPDAIVICTAGDKYYPTPAFDALPPDEKDRIFEATHPRNMPQYFEPRDVLMVLAQSSERVCIYAQRIQMPGELLLGEPEIIVTPQAAFNGRLKIYGVEPTAEALEYLRRAEGGVQ